MSVSANRWIVLLCCVSFVCAAPCVDAASFNATASGPWSSSGTWSPAGGPPTAADGASIGFNGATLVDLTADATIATLGLGNAGQLDLNGHKLVAGTLDIVANLGSPILVQDGGTLLAGELQMTTINVGVQAQLTLGPNDNVTTQIIVQNKSTSLVVNRDLTLSASLFMFFGAKVDVGSHVVTAGQLYSQGDSQFLRLPAGHIDVGSLRVVDGSFSLQSGDSVGVVDIGYQGLAKITLTPAAATGITVTDKITIFDVNSQLNLAFDQQSDAGAWALRWENPQGGNRVAQLLDLQAAGKVTWNRPDVVEVVDRGDGFTYVMIPIPEPSGVALASVGLALLLSRLRVANRATAKS